MKHLKLIFACLLMAVLSIGQMWGTDYYVKVTSAPSDWAGDYLIVYETGNVAFDGSLTTLDAVGNTKAVTISDGKIEATAEMNAIKFTISADASESGWYQLKSASGYYIAGTTKTSAASNGLKSTNAEASKSNYINQPGVGQILSKSSDQNMTLRYNSASNQLRFRYYKTGQQAIALYKFEAGSSTACATPSFSPAAGAVASGTQVAISCSTDDAVIHYTLDGSTPTSSSATYNGAITVSSATTIKAIAVKDGLSDSEVATAAYTILTPQTISAIMPASTDEGDEFLLNDVTVTYAYGSNVYVKDATGYMLVYSAISGAANGKVLQGLQGKAKLYNQLPEISTVTKAPTVTDGSAVAPEALAAYPTDADLNKYVTLEDVTFASAATLSGSVDNVTGRFDDNDLVFRNTFKLSGISLTTGKSYRIVGIIQKFNTNYQVYPISVEEIVAASAPETPTFSVKAGTYAAVQTVEISCATTGATIYYTEDGSTPSASSTEYTAAITVDESKTIKAIAIKDDVESAVATATYTINLPGTSQTWDLSTNSYSAASEDQVTWSGEFVSMVADKHNSSTAANNYLGGGGNAHTRFYKDSKLTFTPVDGKRITSILLTATSSTYAGYLATSNSTWTNAVASASGTLVTVDPTDGSMAVSVVIGTATRITQVLVNYATDDRAAAGLAWSTDAIELTVGDAFTAPTLSNPNEIAAAAISIESSNTDLATVTAGVVELVTDATGSATITATFAGNSSYKPASVSYTITVSAATPVGGYVKVTNIDDFTEGEYLIVYEGDATHDAYALNGALKTADVASNGVAVTISEGTIASSTTVDAAAFTVEAISGGYSFLGSSGKYIGATSYSNAIATSDEPIANTISISGGSAVIGITFSGGTVTMRYNYASDQLRFRYYKSGQQAVQLYKKNDSKSPAGLAYAVAAIEKKVGDAAFTHELTNPHNLTIAYTSDNTDVAEVNPSTGEVTIKAVGVAKITASFDGTGNDDYRSGFAKYTIGVVAHAGTEEDPYTVADAKNVIDALGTKNAVYASGIICQVDAIDLTENFYATYWISADGLTEGQKLEAYHGKYLDNANFSTEDDIKIGDEVVIYGNLKKFSTSVYEFDAGNYLTSLSRTKVAAGLAYETASVEKNVGAEKFTNTLTNPNNVTVAYSSSNASVASVDAETGEVTVNAMGEATITATFAGNASYLPGSVSYTISVNDPSITKVTFDATVDVTSGETVLTLTKNGVTMAISKGQMHNEVSYRLNKDQTLTLSCADGLITRIELEGTDPSYAVTNITASGYSAGVWTGSAESVELVASVAQARMTKINVYYGADSREEAGLAWNPASDIELTVGETLSAPALLNTNSIDVAEITIESSNTAVATVTEGVVELVENATGETTITASFAGNTTYKSTSVSYKITINAAVVPTTGTTYRKVTATENITDGEYLIVYETTGVAFDGSLETLDAEGNSVAVTINEGVIAGTAAIDAAVFTIDVTAGTLQSASGKYIGVSSNSNGLKQTDNAETYTHTFSIDEDKNAVILAAFEGSTMKLRYNPSTAAGNLRFRYYKNDGQQAIQLYKKETAEPVYEELREGVVAGRYYTVCLSKKVVAFRGGNFWSMSKRTTDMAFLEEEKGELPAGTPYIFEVTGTKLEVVYEGAATDVAGTNGALHGTFVDMNQTALNKAAEDEGSDIWLLSNNQLYNVTTTGADGNSLSAGRAYIVYGDLDEVSEAPHLPGRRVRGVPMQGQTATALDNAEASEKPMKMMINGQLFIIRGEKMYDATGRLVK